MTGATWQNPSLASGKQYPSPRLGRTSMREVISATSRFLDIYAR
jgi:hypothetical protein